MIMVCQRRATQARQYRRENRNMLKFMGKIALLLFVATCVSEWFLV